MYVIENEDYAEIKYFRLTCMIKIQLLCLVAVSYVAVQFHVSLKFFPYLTSIASKPKSHNVIT